ncbi:Uncharacterised protein [Yersinia mollaretii]|uniref:DUF6232 family protein n=1 Tax=Yersinia mollaretii TaxID=33060 RepID=UPI0005E70DAF|nr:DUF6232 family protein [Yersinia mollaretii]CNJ97186.1 Uncharacterised protein [Yersinia mollaretii]
MEEKEFFSHGDVRVTNSRFTVSGATYAMNGVTSVKQLQTTPSKVGPVILAIIGAVVTFNADSGGKIIGVLMLLAAIFWFKKIRPEYIVVLNSSSGEAQALRSYDKNYIQSVINALNESIVFRG